MSRRDGFTLLEICLVIMIVLVLFGLAIPSVNGLFAEQRLKKTFEQFDDFVRRTQMRAVKERRGMVMIWDGEGITVQPDEPTEEDTAGAGDYFAFAAHGVNEILHVRLHGVVVVARQIHVTDLEKEMRTAP